MYSRTVFPHRYGPNNIEYRFLNTYTIECITDYMLDEVEMKIIEDLLGVDLRLGLRDKEHIELLDNGKHRIVWSFIESGDLDWT